VYTYVYIYIYIYTHRCGGDGQTGVSRQSAGSSRRGRRTGAVAAQAERKLKKATANLRGTIPRFEEEGASVPRSEGEARLAEESCEAQEGRRATSTNIARTR